MAPVNIRFIVSFSSQDDCHQASNLVASDGSKVWLSNRRDTSGKCEVILQLEKPCQLAYLDIGAVWCANLEVRVGRSDWPQTMEFKLLIPTFTLMSQLDCRLSRGFKSTQMFSKKDFSQDVAHERWDRLHIVCRQPYRRDVQLGLSFIHIRDASTTVRPGNLSAPISDASTLDKSTIGVSPLGKSVVNAASIQKHFFGDVNKTGDDSPTDRLKYRLMKMAGSTENGCEQEQALSRTAMLVLKASENQKSGSPLRTSSPLPRKGLFSEHVAKKNDVPVPEEMKSFLQTLNVTAADVDKVTIADLRHKLERKKKRKLTKEERHTFSEICQDFFYDLFDKNNEPVESGQPGSVLGLKVQSDLPEANTFVGKPSKEPVKAISDGKTQKTPNKKRTSQVNQAENVRHTNLPAVLTKAEKNCYRKPVSTMVNTFSNQDGWIKSPASIEEKVAANVAEKLAANGSRSKILPSTTSSVDNGQIFVDEKHKEIMQHLNTAVSRGLTSHQQKLSLKTPVSSPCQNLPTHTEKKTVPKVTYPHGDVDSVGADSDSSLSLSYDSESDFVRAGDTTEAPSPCPRPGRKIVATEVSSPCPRPGHKIVTTEASSPCPRPSHNVITTEASSTCPNHGRKIVTTEVSPPCPSPGHNIVTTEDIIQPYEKAHSHTGQNKTSALFSSSKPAKLKRLSKASFDIFQEFSMEIMNDDNDESTCEADDHDRSSIRESFQSEAKIRVSSQQENSSVNNAKIVNVSSGNSTPQKIKSQSNEAEFMKKTPKSAKGKIYRMHTSRSKLNVSRTRNISDLQDNYTVPETLLDSCDADRLDTLVNQNCLEYISSCSKDKYVTSPDTINRCQTGLVRATESCAPTFHNSPGNKRTKTASYTSISIQSGHSSDRSMQSSRTGQKSKELSSRRRTRSNPSTPLQDPAFCDHCYGQFPADVLPTHQAFCTPVRPGAPPAVFASPDELLIDETVDYGECPICLQRFPQDVLLVHASECGV